MNLIEVFSRAVGAFVVLFLLTRIMGRKQISQMTFFNYVTGISIGTIAGALTVDPSLKVSVGFVSLVTWSGLTLLVAYIDLKSRKARKLIEGEPVILIKQGKVLEQQLQKQRLDMDELQQLLRSKNVFSIADVHYAILETNGEFSVLLKEEKQPMKQGRIPFSKMQKQTAIPIQLIADGKIIDENLKQINVNRSWIEEQLMVSGTTLSEVFYAELQEDGSLYIDNRTDHFLQ
ncbi:DUF421 domain-containing protein [Neobacillus sp. MM2021_6]|uniref:DUF421 domain-containing protein n=1 Tax=Bacillaceae TaxID=186817 RepID=UPI00140A9691|nr:MULTISPECIES: DUF421 domain-containing protein [Bacillaceae]MBO0961170.1 DUF421 domain-containing protein [Neobacillus sp. MM2021_6]NHC19319.1 DUF421 domain-containing protein [Bacillus sp. MM2020_4]